MRKKETGVIMHKSAKPSRQCAQASKKTNSTVGMIKRTLVTGDKDTILRLYKSLVRPQFEYCIQVWNPYLNQDMAKLGKVQRRATKMIQGGWGRGQRPVSPMWTSTQKIRAHCTDVTLSSSRAKNLFFCTRI